MKKVLLFLIISISLFVMFGCEDVTLPDDLQACHDLEFSNVWGGLEVTGIGKCTHSEVVIPSVHDGKKVISIGKRAFMDCDNITAIAIPGTVKTVKSEAFIACDYLSKVYIGLGVEKLQTMLFYSGSGSMSQINTQYEIYYEGTASEFQKLRSTDLWGGLSRPWFYSGFNTIIFTVYCSDGIMEYNYHDLGEEPVIKEYEDKIPCPYHVDNNDDFICDNCNEKLPGYGETEPEKDPSVGLAFALNEDGKSYSVTGLGRCTDTAIVIPAEYKGLPVTAIGVEAFYRCYSLTSVTIPNSVTTIEDDAFGNCENLTSVTIPDSVTAIGKSAFYECYSLTSVTIPNSVTTIGEYAFNICTRLTEFVVSAENVNYSVDDNGILYNKDRTTLIQAPGAIYGDITIPYGVTAIGDSAFYWCDGLTGVTIPNSITTIGKCAFTYCTNLTGVTIPNSVTAIGDSAFARCFNLASVTIPNSVTTIGDGAFISCTRLTAFEVSAKNAYFSVDKDGILYNKDKTLLICAPGAIFGGITLPDGVAIIGNLAFGNCENLTSVTIPDSVTSIGNGTFRDCESLTSVTIPDSVTTIGVQAFYGCESLTSITIPSSVTTIGDWAFSDCTSLTYNIYDNAKYLGNNTNSYVVLIGATSKSITSCDIHPNTKVIYADAFYDCDSLTSVTIGDSVTTIGSSAFSSCSSLTSATIPDSVTTIGDYAFYGCESLTSITIPNSVTTISHCALYYCNSLTSITYKGTIKQWQAIDISDYFDDGTDNYTIYCTDGKISKDGTVTYY